MVILGAALSPMAIDEQIESSSSVGAIRVDELDHYEEDWIPPFVLKSGVRIRSNEKFSDFYELREEIGQGKFGTVYRCVEWRTGLVLAAKSIRLKKDTDFKKVEKEVDIMTKMRHKCIAQIYDAFVTPNKDVILVMEIVEGGELFDRVEEDSYILSEMAVSMVVYQILEAIRYIHDQKIIHLDLKPENIMCVSKTSNEIKLIDFGLAQYYDGQSDLLFMAGTPEFAAPEVIRYEPLSFHTDMWSLGVITYILLSGVSPFLGETTAHTYCNVEKAKWTFCKEFAENGISEEAKDFISKLMIFEKEKRMLPVDAIQHKWIVQCKQRASASRSVTPVNLPNIEKPLDITKLRQYVRNKRFRRLVFGVMFLNSVVKMMQTFRANKSSHGIEYVKNMIKVAEDSKHDASTSQETKLMKIFTKKRRKDTSGEAMDINERKRQEEKKDDQPKQKVLKERPKSQLDVKVVDSEAEELSKRRRTAHHGTKKKRSKSASRKTDQTRTRSSTEQTSKKKQKRETLDRMYNFEETCACTTLTFPPPSHMSASTSAISTSKTNAGSKSPLTKRSVKFEQSTENTKEGDKGRKVPMVTLSQPPTAFVSNISNAIVGNKTLKTEQVGRAKTPEPKSQLTVNEHHSKTRSKTPEPRMLTQKAAESNAIINQSGRSPVTALLKKLEASQNSVTTTLQTAPKITITPDEVHFTTPSVSYKHSTRSKTPEPDGKKDVVLKKTTTPEPQSGHSLLRAKLAELRSKTPEPRMTLDNNSKKLNESEESLRGEKKSVAELLKKLEGNKGDALRPLAFAVTAFQPSAKKKERRGRSTSVGKIQKNSETTNRTAKEEPCSSSKTIRMQLERRIEEEERTKVTSRTLKREENMEKTVGNELKEKRTVRNSQNDVVTSLDKKVTISERSKSNKEVKEDSVKMAFHTRNDETEHLKSPNKMEKTGEHNTTLVLERQTKLNGAIETSGSVRISDAKKDMVNGNLEESSLELQRTRLRNVQVRENEQKKEAEANSVQKITIKRVKRKKKKTHSSVDEAAPNGLLFEFKSKHGYSTTPSSNKKSLEGGLTNGNGRLSTGQKAVSGRFTDHLSMEVAECGGWGAIGQDVFDFNLLRKKLQNRIMGMKNEDELATEEENRQKCEMRVKIGTNSIYVKQAMKKWILSDKEQLKQ